MKIKNKKRSIIITVIMLALIIVIIGGSYAYFTSVIESGEQKYNVGTLAVDYGKRTNSINLEEISPLTDGEGLKTTPHEFTVTNNGSIGAKYQIRLELNNKNTIEISKIKVSYSKNGSEYTKPVLLSELNNNLALITEQGLESGHTDTYQLKMWIDYNAGNEVQGKEFGAKIVIDGVQSSVDKIEVDTAPIIYLNGGDINLIIGNEFIDPGISKIEDDKEELTEENVSITYEYYDMTIESENEIDKIISVESIDTTRTGVYYIKYTIMDSFGNIGTAIRTVIINETETTPTITLNGSNNITLTVGDKYTEEGITTDTQNNVAIIGEVKTDVVGTYVVRYIVIDKNNNLASTTRTVVVNPKTVIVVFNATGGEVETTQKVVIEGNTYGTLPTPTRTGYTFNGWWSEPNEGLTTQNNENQNGNQITEQTLFTENSEKTLYAHWTSNEYVMTMDYQYDNLKEIKNNIAYGYKINDLTKSIDAREYSALKREGYTFLGWYDDQVEGNQITGDTVVNFTEDFTLYAHWQANVYLVSFDANNGSSVASTITVTQGNSYGQLPITTREGYNFDGWYTQLDGGVKIEADTIFNFNEDITLYAHWTRTSFTLTFDAQGGSVVPSTKEITKGQQYGDLPTPTLDGYNFVGWYTTGNSKIESTDICEYEENITVYAHWEAKTYTLTFDAQGGSVIPETKDVVYTALYGSLPTATKTGYTMSGWYTEEGEQITDTTRVEVIGDHTLYARYTPNSNTAYKVQHWKQKLTGNVNVHDSNNYDLVTEDTQTLYGTTDATVQPVVKEYTGFISPAVENLVIAADGNAVLNYYYTRNSYTITIYSGTGIQQTSITAIPEAVGGKILYGATVTVGYQEATGYDYFDITGDVSSLTFTMPANNITATVNGTPEYYTLTINPKGGSIPITSGWTLKGDSTATKTIAYNSPYGTIPTPTKSGYTFMGWFNYETYNSQPDYYQITSTSVVEKTGNQTLYAEWSANTNTSYVVNYYQKDLGSNTYTLYETQPKTGTTDAEITISTLANPYTGFTFQGGKAGTSASNQLPASFDSTTTILGNSTRVINMYYTRNSYYLDLNGQLDDVHNGGLADYGTADVYINNVKVGTSVADWFTTYEYGTTYEIKNIQATTGHTYNGVYIGTLSGTITDFTEVRLNFTTNKYTVYLNEMGGSDVSDLTNKAHGSTYGTLPTPTRTGYTFNGWWTEPNTGLTTENNYNQKGTQVTSTNQITSTHTLYAHWTSLEVGDYIANYQYNNIIEYHSRLAYGYKLKDISGFCMETNCNSLLRERTGYTFLGWYDYPTAGNQITNEKVINWIGDFTIYAHWRANAYQVSFDPQNGSTISTILTVTYGSTYGTLPTPETTGHTFDGWYTEPSGGTKIVSTSTKNTAYNEKLYAHWTPNNYTLTLNANGGTSSLPSVTLTYRTSNYYNLSGNIPTRTGYTFDGWYTQASGGVQVYNSSGYVTNEGTYWQNNTSVYAGNYTLYAHWTGIQSTVFFDSNGGSTSTSSKAVTYGSSYLTLPTPTRTGYTFAGWYTAASGGSYVSSTTTVSNYTDHTLYAHWTQKTYTIYFKDEYTASGNTYTVTCFTKTATYGSNSVYDVNSSTNSCINSVRFNGWWTSGGTQVYDFEGYGVPGTSYFDNNGNWIYDGSVTLYSRYSDYLTVSFNANGGTTPKLQKYVFNGYKYGILPTPTRSVGTFLGWFTSATGGTQVTSTTTVTSSSSHTLYAHWGNIPQYNITFNDNIDYFTPTNGTQNGVKIKYDNTTRYLTLNGTMSDSFSYNILSTSFIENEQYSVELEYISGSYTATSGLAFAVEVRNNLLGIKPDRNYCDTSYPTSGKNSCILTISSLGASTGNKLDIWSYIQTANTVTFNNYVIKVNINKVNTITNNLGDTLSTIPIPTRNNFTFMGWYTAPTGGTQVISSSGVPVTGTYFNSSRQYIYNGNLTLYARWKVSGIYIKSYRSTNSGSSWSTWSGGVGGTSGKYFANPTTDLTSGNWKVSVSDYSASIVGTGSVTSSTTYYKFEIYSGNSTASSNLITTIVDHPVEYRGSGTKSQANLSW